VKLMIFLTALLVTGRPISADHQAHSSLRVMPIAAAIGEAAGVAAALAVQQHQPVNDIDVAQLRQRLTERGGSLSASD